MAAQTRRVILLAAWLAGAGGVSAGPAERHEPPPRVAVLDTTGSWRLHHTLAPPVMRTATGLETVLATGQKWLHETTPAPPAGWTEPGFDDSDWLRGPARIAAPSPMLSRLCLRGKFTVTDPDRVRGLKLSVGYYGGAVLYVNGREIARGHLGPGDAGRRGPARTYPRDAYFFGRTNTWTHLTGGKADELDRIRTRLLERIPVPSRLLRKGVNVVAIEIVRPAENECVRTRTNRRKRKTPVNLAWATCAIRHVRLGADSAGGLTPNALRPKGLQVWNNSVLANDFAMDFGDPLETLRPVRIVGARNGSFSGKVVVGSTAALRGLRARVSDLTGAGRIPASAVRIRCAVPWGAETDADARYTTEAVLLGALAETPPKEIPVRATRRTWRNAKLPSSPPPVFGAVVPVWLTVDVPAGAAGGDYAGTLTLSAAGVAPVTVPIRLRLADWTLPDRQDYRTWVELIQSPDTLVEEYGLRRWSDRHFRLIARSMKHLHRIGSRILYIPVICHT
ncbi:MAG: hypothetical protein ACYS5V_02230, partial [Planctomycetota bacterium]